MRKGGRSRETERKMKGVKGETPEICKDTKWGKNILETRNKLKKKGDTHSNSVNE